jgi:long-subunit acyl-CoA synthetase (AMP-forming)
MWARGTHVELKIVDANRKEVPRWATGEVAARGPMIMLGYWNKPKETTAVLENGWYYSGDAAYMDDEGFVFIVDRLKDARSLAPHFSSICIREPLTSKPLRL